MRLFAIDLDGAVVRQPFFTAEVAAGAASVVPAADLASRLRLVASATAVDELCNRISQTMGSDRGDVELVFYGSGDFHHLTTCLLERHTAPLTVVHVDNHPDWVTFPRSLNCGSWVNHALDMPQVVEVLTLGPAGADLQWPELKAGNLKAIVQGRLRIVPWRPTQSYVLRRHGDSACWRQRGRRLHWKHADIEDWAAQAEQLVASISTERVYLTIDKDALVQDEAITNWDQGLMTVSQVEALVRVLARQKQVVGVDVCGDYSVPRLHDVFRRVISYFDRDEVSVTPEMLARNSATNARLLHMFSALASPRRATADAL